MEVCRSSARRSKLSVLVLALAVTAAVKHATYDIIPVGGRFRKKSSLALGIAECGEYYILLSPSTMSLVKLPIDRRVMGGAIGNIAGNLLQAILQLYLLRQCAT